VHAVETLTINDRGPFDPSNVSRVSDAINSAHRVRGGASMATAVINAREAYFSATSSSNNVDSAARV
jgi:hypothetical protein